MRARMEPQAKAGLTHRVQTQGGRGPSEARGMREARARWPVSTVTKELTAARERLGVATNWSVLNKG